MRRPTRVWGLLIAGGALVTLFLFPTLSSAANAQRPSYEGTYSCKAVGTSKEGKSATSGVTAWVQDKGEKTRLVFHVSRLSLAFALVGKERWVNDHTVAVYSTYSSLGIDVRVTVRLVAKDGAWTLSGFGSGELVSYDGKGRLKGRMTATGTVLPSILQQIKDTGIKFIKGPPKPSEITSNDLGAGEEDNASTDPSTVVVVKEASVVAPAEAGPPIPDLNLLESMAILLFFMAMAAIFGILSPAEWVQAATGGGQSEEIHPADNEPVTADHSPITDAQPPSPASVPSSDAGVQADDATRTPDSSAEDSASQDLGSPAGGID